MLNIPRALFESRTGRQPLYHAGIDELQDWIYTGAPLVPLKGLPGHRLAARATEEARQSVRSVLMPVG